MPKVIIVGSGPAGVIAGNYLLKAGFEVTIFEKNSRVISTPCGEGISDTATEKLKMDIGFDSSRYFSTEVKGLINFFPGKYHSYIYQPGHVLEREKWIDGIRKHFEKNGGTVEFNHTVENLKSLKADVIVGADGPTSIVRQHINGKIKVVTASQYKIELDWENRDFLEFYWDLEISDYYAWNFPKKNYFNVGVLGNINKLNQFCDKYRIKGNIIKTEAFAIPYDGTHIHEGNIYLVGDAGGMANAFSKGGLAPAIYASDILASSLSEGRGADYEKRIKAHPAFSRIYVDAMRTLLSLGQNNLELLGEIVHTHELLKLPLKAKMKAMRKPRLFIKANKVLNAFDKGIVYAW